MSFILRMEGAWIYPPMDLPIKNYQKLIVLYVAPGYGNEGFEKEYSRCPSRFTVRRHKLLIYSYTYFVFGTMLSNESDCHYLPLLFKHSSDSSRKSTWIQVWFSAIHSVALPDQSPPRYLEPPSPGISDVSGIASWPTLRFSCEPQGPLTAAGCQVGRSGGNEPPILDHKFNHG